ncbi:MAG TPA: TonB-dependent receptor [Opitutaceae bacterium]|nr:TonB-dependent receptor [Opitutaceae bacterium]
MTTTSGATVLLAALLATGAAAAGEPSVALPEYTVYSPRVALQEPAGAFAMPVTALRFEPLVDVQVRNLAESQADVTIRGGVFENTGFRIGGVALYDPQTGHYFAEIPVAPAMLSAPRIVTGSDNGLEGFNAAVGTVVYDWQRIRARGELAVSAGQDQTYRLSLYEGVVDDTTLPGRTLASDAEVSRSVSDGSVRFGDHRFQRYNIRLQIADATAQTDLFYGYQSKLFGWPNLYTPFGSNESENLETVLVALNHRVRWSAGDWLEAGAFWRRNKDDYAFNRFAPLGPVHPFQHTTWAEGATVSGHDDLGAVAVAYGATVLADDLKSTALVYGRFHSRTYVKAAASAEKAWTLDPRHRVTVRAGASFDDTDRDTAAVSPLFEVALDATAPDRELRRYALSYAQSTQVPTYTALNSSATAGLFRGNPDLGRTTSRAVELAAEGGRGIWQAHVAAFYRRDDRLVDWTFRQGVTARTANPVDVDTVGLEAVARCSGARGELVVGYAVMHKAADYGPAQVDGSFYALNYPEQRLTAAVIVRLGGGFEVRMDNQARIQAANPLRTVGGDRAVISALGLFYRPPRAPSFGFSLQVDNLWNSDFEEVPAVPAARREISAGVTSRW